MKDVWRALNAAEDGREADDNEPAFGAYQPNAVQSAMIAVARRSVLRRGVFRAGWSSLVFRAGGLSAGKEGRGLDISFRGCNFRLRGERNLIDHGLLLNPGYNKADIDFLLDGACDDANFVDIGSNVGLYGLPLARSAPQGRTLCIDANPLMAKRLTFNAAATNLANLIMVSCAVSDVEGRADLRIRADDTAIVAVEERHDGEVPVRRLDAILAEHGMDRLHGLKIDIEGHEDKALAPFLRDADVSQLPQRVVIETSATGQDYPDCTEAFAARGYRLVARTRNNSLYQLGA